MFNQKNFFCFCIFPPSRLSLNGFQRRILCCNFDKDNRIFDYFNKSLLNKLLDQNWTLHEKIRNRFNYSTQKLIFYWVICDSAHESFLALSYPWGRRKTFELICKVSSDHHSTIFLFVIASPLSKIKLKTTVNFKLLSAALTAFGKKHLPLL